MAVGGVFVYALASDKEQTGGDTKRFPRAMQWPSECPGRGEQSHSYRGASGSRGAWHARWSWGALQGKHRASHTHARSSLLGALSFQKGGEGTVTGGASASFVMPYFLSKKRTKGERYKVQLKKC